MTSILLLEAALMGRPSASFRPNARTTFPIADLYPELITTLSDRKALRQWLERGSSGSSAPQKRAAFEVNAAANVSTVLQHLAMSSRSAAPRLAPR